MRIATIDSGRAEHFQYEKESCGKMDTITELLRIKRAYEAPAEDDGERILVDRLWPRGIKKENLQIAGWWKELAPSSDLRKWFAHIPERFPEFKERYLGELSTSEEAAARREEIRTMLAEGKAVTLLYGAKDPEHNNAVVLREWILSE